MNVHLLQHVPFEDPAHISSWRRLNSISSSTSLLYDSPHFPNLNGVQGRIILGGPMSVHDTQTYPWLAPEEHFIREAILAGIPTLGICLGARLIAEILGAKITPGRCKEIGWFPVQHTTPNTTNPFTTLLPDQFTPFHWHGETFSLPPNALHLASSPAASTKPFPTNPTSSPSSSTSKPPRIQPENSSIIAPRTSPRVPIPSTPPTSSPPSSSPPPHSPRKTIRRNLIS